MMHPRDVFYVLGFLALTVYGLFADSQQWDSHFWPYSDLAFWGVTALFLVIVVITNRRLATK